MMFFPALVPSGMIGTIDELKSIGYTPSKPVPDLF